MSLDTDLLNSWKEIAAYLGRGTRTVQRWEVDLGLPVHRLQEHLRTAVTAFKSEVDVWAKKGAGDYRAEPSFPAREESRSILRQNRRQMRILALTLRRRLARNRQLVERACALAKRGHKSPDSV